MKPTAALAIALLLGCSRGRQEQHAAAPRAAAPVDAGPPAVSTAGADISWLVGTWERQSAPKDWLLFNAPKEAAVLSGKPPTVTYHLNRLQRLGGTTEYCVTLNPNGSIDEGRVLKKMVYTHPLYTREAVRAQSRWDEVSGAHRTHFAGAYWYYGFHEDGLNSALRVARRLGVEW